MHSSKGPAPQVQPTWDRSPEPRRSLNGGPWYTCRRLIVRCRQVKTFPMKGGGNQLGSRFTVRVKTIGAEKITKTRFFPKSVVGKCIVVLDELDGRLIIIIRGYPSGSAKNPSEERAR